MYSHFHKRLYGFFISSSTWYQSHNLFSPPPSDATVVIPGAPPLPTPKQYLLLPNFPSSPLSGLLVVKTTGVVHRFTPSDASLRTTHLFTPTSSIPSYYKVCINNLWLLHTLRLRVPILHYHTSDEAFCAVGQTKFIIPNSQ